MARRRREQSPSDIKLKQPDRSGPTEKTLLEIAQQRGLFDQAKKREQEIGKKAVPVRIPRPRKDGDESGEDGEDDDEVGLPPGAERVLETSLWSVSLSMLHLTLDVLVHQQYSVDSIVWPNVLARLGQALLRKLVFPWNGRSLPCRRIANLDASVLPVFSLLIYVLHPHATSPRLIPGLPLQYQSFLRQAIFFTTSVYAGCYLIHITNTAGYMAVMKQAPALGCLWVWSVIELELPWAVLSLTGAGTFLWQKGYSIR